MAGIEATIRAFTAAILDAIPDGVQIDFVEQVAAILPIKTILTVSGIDPANVAELKHWSDEMMKSGSAPADAAIDDEARAHPERDGGAAPLDTPVRGFLRGWVQDTEPGGQELQAGERIFLSWTAANRDPSVWPDPDRLDVTRQPDPKHIAFGFGEHIRAGAALARLEIRVFWEEFLGRFSRWELAGEPHRPDSTMHNSFESSRCAFIDADPTLRGAMSAMTASPGRLTLVTERQPAWPVSWRR